MTLPPAWRKLTLAVHLAVSVGWVGGVLVYLALGIAATRSADEQTIRAAWIAMEVTGWYVLVPMAVATLVTGLTLALGTRWGLARHYWVLISFGLTLVATVVLVLHMPGVTAAATSARTANLVELRRLGGDLLHPGVGLGVLLTVLTLNLYKPKGLTRHGWRAQQRESGSTADGVQHPATRQR